MYRDIERARGGGRRLVVDAIELDGGDLVELDEDGLVGDEEEGLVERVQDG